MVWLGFSTDGSLAITVGHAERDVLLEGGGAGVDLGDVETDADEVAADADFGVGD